MDSNLFDLIICVGPNDTNILNSMLSFNKKNIIGYRNIYLICANPNIKIVDTIIIDETIFPFTIHDLNIQFGKNTRNGWYLQQLIKMYAGIVIPGILEKYLVVDCDTLFLKPTTFITQDGKYNYATGNEYHIPYFIHMNKLDTSFKKNLPVSGICHHMFFDTKIVNELINKVEKNNNNSKKFWQLFLDVVDLKEFPKSGASEYEIYFNYMYSYHKDKMCIRQLNWKNVTSYNTSYDNIYDFVSIHWYLREK
jgi:hypothetical protein